MEPNGEAVTVTLKPWVSHKPTTSPWWLLFTYRLVQQTTAFKFFLIHCFIWFLQEPSKVLSVLTPHRKWKKTEAQRWAKRSPSSKWQPKTPGLWRSLVLLVPAPMPTPTPEKTTVFNPSQWPMSQSWLNHFHKCPFALFMNKEKALSLEGIFQKWLLTSYLPDLCFQLNLRSVSTCVPGISEFAQADEGRAPAWGGYLKTEEMQAFKGTIYITKWGGGGGLFETPFFSKVLPYLI